MTAKSSYNQYEMSSQTDTPLHRPVLLTETLSALSETPSPAPISILDCTFGRGGHSLAFLDRFPKAKVTALDWDEEAVEYGKTLPQAGRIKFLRMNFHFFPEKLQQSPSFLSNRRPFDIVFMDLGVSSPHVDQGGRGFSFHRDGPLDMRMDQRKEISAESLVNALSKRELIRLFQKYGEIRRPFSVVHAIFERRKKRRIKTTGELARLIQKHAPASRPGRHPATPYFLALRMKVNGELEGLEKSLPAFPPILKKKGVLMVISFHSLEDRIIKQAFRRFVQEGKGALWNKKALTPSPEERKRNPRSRSAKLRVFVKG